MQIIIFFCTHSKTYSQLLNNWLYRGREILLIAQGKI